MLFGSKEVMIAVYWSQFVINIGLSMQNKKTVDYITLCILVFLRERERERNRECTPQNRLTSLVALPLMTALKYFLRKGVPKCTYSLPVHLTKFLFVPTNIGNFLIQYLLVLRTKILEILVVGTNSYPCIQACSYKILLAQESHGERVVDVYVFNLLTPSPPLWVA